MGYSHGGIRKGYTAFSIMRFRGGTDTDVVLPERAFFEELLFNSEF